LKSKTEKPQLTTHNFLSSDLANRQTKKERKKESKQAAHTP
jgi:hypothetical protein